MFENECKQSDTRGCEVRLMLFNIVVIKVLLYGVAISHSVNGMKLRTFKFCSCINNWELNPQHPIVSCYHKQVLGR